MTHILHLLAMIVAPVAGAVTLVSAALGDTTVAACFGSVGGAAAILWLFFDWLADREFIRDINHEAGAES
jgi:O-antigen/teichoic acid export membrane protein